MRLATAASSQPPHRTQALREEAESIPLSSKNYSSRERDEIFTSAISADKDAPSIVTFLTPYLR
jgi:hypothetical protein